MVDPPRLLALLERIGDEVEELRELADRGADRLLGDKTGLAAAKYRLVVAIEAAIDAGQHVVASEGLRTPGNFAEVFEVLGENGFVAEEDVPPLMDMARFRNVLVHGYADVDDGRVVEVVMTRLGDLDRFCRAVGRILGS